jgi:DNA-binding NtrC family response regulator
VVDDEELVRRSTVRLLEQAGYHVLTARDGMEAIERYKEHCAEVSLVLLDLMMPKMSGEQVFRALKKIDGNVRVLVTSGYSDEDKARSVIESGAAGFLQKPYDAAGLSDAMRRALLGQRE